MQKKAKSRLKSTFANDDTPVIISPTVAPRIKKNQKRLAHLNTFVIGILFGALLLSLIFFVPPSSVKNWLIPNSYLPFFLLLIGTGFFLFSFIFLNSFLGIWWTAMLIGLIFLKIQQVTFGSSLIIFFLAWFFVGLFLTWKTLKNRR